MKRSALPLVWGAWPGTSQADTKPRGGLGEEVGTVATAVIRKYPFDIDSNCCKGDH